MVLEGLFGVAWTLLEASLGAWGRSWELLEASWRLLEASWARLGRLLGASWAQLEKVARGAPSWDPNLEAKIQPSWLQNPLKNQRQKKHRF